MSSTNPSKGRNGMRILWIPGRKKHQHKGRYESTSKTVVPHHRQKNNEPWAVGGSFGQRELLKG